MNSEETLILQAMNEMEQQGGLIRLQFGKNQTVFEPKTDSGGSYWMKDGQIKLETLDSGGKVHFLHILSGARVFGLGPCLLNRPVSYQARALDEVTFYWLDPTSTRKFLDGHPELKESLMRQLGSELEVLESRLRSACTLSLTDRVYETLAYLKACDPVRNWTHHQIADWSGVSRGSVNQSLQELQDQGRIWVQGRKITLLRKMFLN
jgi:CRP-like cAMP-binding protein